MDKKKTYELHRRVILLELAITEKGKQVSIDGKIDFELSRALELLREVESCLLRFARYEKGSLSRG